MEDIVNEELLEDGTKKISIYSGQTHKLIKYYHLNDKGQKHGVEVESKDDLTITTQWKNGEMVGTPVKHGIEVKFDYLTKIKTITRWENGEMVGKPARYETRHGDDIRMVDHLSELEDNQTHYVRLSSDCHEVKDTPLAKVLTSVDGTDFIFGVPTGYIEPIMIRIKDNQIECVKINGFSFPKRAPDQYRSYYMEFKDGKEYNGSFTYGIKTEKGKRKSTTLCKYTEGECTVFKEHMSNVSFQLSEELKNSPQNISMSDDARASLAVVRALREEHALLGRIHYHINPDNVEKLSALIILPKDGSVSYNIGDSQYNFTIKDGKLDGEFSEIKNDSLHKKAYYKDSRLNGPYQEFFENSSKMKISGSYKDDKKHGIWKYYDQEGKVIKTELWNDGVDETAKYATMRKVTAKYAEHCEPVTKVGKAIKKAIKSIEVGRELKKLKEQNRG